MKNRPDKTIQHYEFSYDIISIPTNNYGLTGVMMSFGHMYYLIQAFVSNYTMGRLTDTFNLTDNDINLIDRAKKINERGMVGKGKRRRKIT